LLSIGNFGGDFGIILFGISEERLLGQVGSALKCIYGLLDFYDLLAKIGEQFVKDLNSLRLSCPLDSLLVLNILLDGIENTEDSVNK